MPIEFLCDGCQQQLRVPDDSAGKQAKCPNCSAVLTVPVASPNAPDPTPLINPLGAGGASPRGNAAEATPNPYASPSAVSQSSPFVPGELSVQLIDPGYALSSAWALFKTNAGVLIGSYVVLMVCNFGISFVGAFIQGTLAQALADPQAPAVMLTGVGSSILNQVVQLWLTVGFIRITLAVARNQPAEIAMLMSGGPYLLRYIGAAILFGLAVFVGFLLLIVPGIYIALTYWSYMYFIIDRNCGVFESFQLAGTHAAGNRGNVFLLGLIAMGLMVLGMLACGVGILVAGPLVMMMFTIAYLMMTGQYFSQPR